MDQKLGCTGLIWMCLGACYVDANQVAIDDLQLGVVPVGYYDTANSVSSSALKQSLHEIIDDHKRASYSGTWAILEAADAELGNSKQVRDIYQNKLYKKVSTDRPYNREHVWPKSIGFPVGDGNNLPFTDCHHLFLSTPSYNSARNNKPFGNCVEKTCAEFPVLEFNDANLTEGDHGSGVWETWSGRRGDVARAIFYMDVRYEGGKNGNTNSWEPDLRTTDDETLWMNSMTSKNEKIAYMGSVTNLLQWHHEDPPDEYERQHNEAVYKFQGNRNPFVDHPEWVECVFENKCENIE